MVAQFGKGWVGSHGKARPFREGPEPGTGAVGGWLVLAPFVHPVWDQYLFQLIHLREIDGMKPAVITLPDATHELYVWAIDPSKPVGSDAKEDAQLALLQPLNQLVQFIAPSDEAAKRRCLDAVLAVIAGRLSCDDDFRTAFETFIRRPFELTAADVAEAAMGRIMQEVKGAAQDEPAVELDPTYDPRHSTLTDGSPVTKDHREIEPSGMQKGYVVLSEAERAKGFVRAVRTAYRHTKCGHVTTMGLSIAETYARQPDYYSGTFCFHCRDHLPVGADGEFVWLNNDGTETEKVGT